MRAVKASLFLMLGLVSSYLAAVGLGVLATSRQGSLTRTSIDFGTGAGRNQLLTKKRLGFTDLELSPSNAPSITYSDDPLNHQALWEELNAPSETVDLPWWADQSDRNTTESSAKYRAIGFPLRMIIHKVPKVKPKPSVRQIAHAPKAPFVPARDPDSPFGEEAPYPDGIAANGQGTTVLFSDPPRASPPPPARTLPQTRFDLIDWHTLRVTRKKSLASLLPNSNLGGFGPGVTGFMVYSEDLPLIPSVVPWLANGVMHGFFWWLIALPLLAILPARRRKRLRREGKCIKCKYDLTGIGADQPCPECGREDCTA